MSRTATTQWRRITRIIREQGAAHNTPCHICGGARGPIDYRTQAQADRDAEHNGQYWLIKQPRPLALDVDHITPHAAGGQDTLANAAPTHAVCNRQAGAKSTPKRVKETTVTGFWWPKNGQTKPLKGRARPGTQTRTHIFHADPGPHPLPPPPSRPPIGVVNTSTGSRPPRGPQEAL